MCSRSGEYEQTLKQWGKSDVRVETRMPSMSGEDNQREHGVVIRCRATVTRMVEAVSADE